MWSLGPGAQSQAWTGLQPDCSSMPAQGASWDYLAACSRLPTAETQPILQQAPPHEQRGCGHRPPGNMQLITNSGTGGGPA